MTQTLKANTTPSLANQNTPEWLIHRKCPGCGAEAQTPTITSTVPAESIPYELVQQTWVGFSEGRPFFSYWRCTHCWLLYCPTFLSVKALSDLYRSMPANMSLVPLAALRRTQEGYASLLQRHCKLEGQYLELGPDRGLFAKACLRLGNFSKMYLVEPNKEIHSELRQTLNEIPTEIFSSDEELNSIENNSLSVAVIIHVLDHFLDPAGTLKIINQKLSKNGILFLITHNESSLISKLFGSRWPAYCLQHPQLFQPRSIKTVLEAAGFENLGTEKTVNHFPVFYLFQHLLLALGFPVNPRASLDRVSIGLRLGNFATLGIKRHE